MGPGFGLASRKRNRASEEMVREGSDGKRPEPEAVATDSVWGLCTRKLIKKRAGREREKRRSLDGLENKGAGR